VASRTLWRKEKFQLNHGIEKEGIFWYGLGKQLGVSAVNQSAIAENQQQGIKFLVFLGLAQEDDDMETEI